MINAKKNAFWNSNDIVNSNDIKRTIVNVDSRFRESPTDTTTDFHYRPAIPYKNIIRLRLVSAEIPNMFYAFSPARKNVAFRVILESTGAEYVAQIDEGNYTLGTGATNLLNAIQFELTQISTAIGGGMDLKIQLDPVRTQIVIFDDGPSPQNFILDFRYMSWDRPNDWGLGYSLGFRHRVYGRGSRFLAEAPPDVHLDTYLLLAVNDYESFQLSSGSLGIYCFAKIIVKEDKYNIIFADEASIYTREYVFQQPVNIPRFHIRLMDMYGNTIDNRQVNMSLSFEISEITNSKLYKDFLNYNQ